MNHQRVSLPAIFFFFFFLTSDLTEGHWENSVINWLVGFRSFPLSLFQNGQTPLMVAAEQGSLEIVQELIRRGANVNLDDVVSMHTHKRDLSNSLMWARPHVQVHVAL